MCKEDFKVYSGEHICLIRTLCTRASFCEILNKVKKSFDFTLRDIKTVAFLEYIGLEYSIEKMLEKNLKIKNFASNSSFVKNVTRNEFVLSQKRRLVLEVIIDDMCDVTDIHYLILLLEYLEFKNEKYYVLISGTRTNTKRYSALKTSDYFKISYFLYFFGNTVTDNHSKIFNQIKACCHNHGEAKNIGETVNAIEDVRWCALALNYEKQPVAGRIVPIIPVTNSSFEALITDYISIKQTTTNYWQIKIEGLCNDYINRVAKIDSSILAKEVSDLLESDNCLEALIFLATLYYIVAENKEGYNQLTSLLSISKIHELCVDYSQGIIQLAENIINHVICGDEDKGVGVFSIRFRTKSDAKSIYLNKEDFYDVNYFMEIYMTDFQFYDFEGIVEKFYGNVKRRIIDNCYVSDELLVNSKFYFSQVDDAALMKKLNDNIGMEVVDKIRTYIDNIKSDSYSKVKLSDLFLNKFNIPLRDYLSSSENIAFHYGLQILNSVISVADGYLYVKSGTGSDNIFSNNFNKVYRDVPEFIYDFGTLYVIRIPLRLKNSISYLDSIAVSNNVMTPKCVCAFFDAKEQLPIGDKSYQSKMLYRFISECFNEYGLTNEECVIGVLDCRYLFGMNLYSKTYTYEIVAKALFLYLVNENSKIDNIALINVDNKYDVIKIFRQFALFFDRNGCNYLIKKSKSVFIVDRNGQTDILFYGNTIKSISNSLCLSQLYGGADEKAMEIIRCLVRDEHE